MINPEAAAILENRRREVTGALEGLIRKHPAVTLEMGCGHGHFLTAYAEASPGEFCLGIDRQGNRITRSLRKQGHARLPNLQFLRAEIGQFLECLPGELVFNRIFVLFPDPWPKRRHHKNRLLGPFMLERLADHAATGAGLFLRSDDFDYLDWVREHIGDSTAWRLDPDCPWPFEFETVFQSKARDYRSLIAVRSGRARTEKRSAKASAIPP